MKKLLIFWVCIAISQPILSQTLRLTSPNGGEKLVVGENTIITWEGISPSENVSLEYSIDKGNTWKLITNKAAGLQYKWNNIPNETSNECLIRVKYNYCYYDTIINSAPIIEWQKTFGGDGDDFAHSIQQTYDGGYIIAGSTTTINNGDVTENKGKSDFWVMKLTWDGRIEWQKTYGGSSFDNAYSIQQTFDKGYIIVGSTESNDGDVADFKGFRDNWVVKLNENGYIEWQKTLGGSDFDGAYSVEQTTDSGFIVAGYIHSNNGDIIDFKGAVDIWILKLSSSGSIEWQKSFGGTDTETPYCIRQTIDKGYIIVGDTYSFDGDINNNIKGTADFWIIKIDSMGIIEWQKTLGGGDWEEANSVQQTKDGGYIVAGATISNDGDVPGIYGGFDLMLLKFNYKGKLEWYKPIGGSAYDVAYSIQETCDEGFIITGCTESKDFNVTENKGKKDFWVLKLYKDSSIQWQKTFGGSGDDVARSIQQTSDGGIIVAGYTTSNDGDISVNKGKNDVWVIKFSPAGEVSQQDVSDTVFSIVSPSITLQTTSAEAFVGDNIEIPITLSTEDNIAITGISAFSIELVFNKTLLFPINSLNSHQEGNLLVLKLDSLPIPTANNTELTRVKFIAALGNAEQTELTLRKVTPLGGFADITVTNGIFTLKGICKEGDIRLVNGLSQTSFLSVTPNPASGIIEISYANSDDGSAEFCIMDILGKTISTTALSKTQKGFSYIDVSFLHVGQYFGLFRTQSVRKNIMISIIK